MILISTVIQYIYSVCLLYKLASRLGAIWYRGSHRGTASVVHMLCPLSHHLILSGAHYHFVLIFRLYLVLLAFTAYWTLTRDYQDLNT